MPITEQLRTSEQLQQAGLPRAAAVLLAENGAVYASRQALGGEAAAQPTHA